MEPSVEPWTASAPSAALIGSDSNHSSVNSTADIDRLRMTRNMSLRTQATQPPCERGQRPTLFDHRRVGETRHRRALGYVEERRGRVHELHELGPARGIAFRQPPDRIERGRVARVRREPEQGPRRAAVRCRRGQRRCRLSAVRAAQGRGRARCRGAACRRRAAGRRRSPCRTRVGASWPPASARRSSTSTLRPAFAR